MWEALYLEFLSYRLHIFAKLFVATWTSISLCGQFCTKIKAWPRFQLCLLYEHEFVYKVCKSLPIVMIQSCDWVRRVLWDCAKFSAHCITRIVSTRYKENYQLVHIIDLSDNYYKVKTANFYSHLNVNSVRWFLIYTPLWLLHEEEFSTISSDKLLRLCISIAEKENKNLTRHKFVRKLASKKSRRVAPTNFSNSSHK